MSMRIDVGELRRAANILLDHLEATGRGNIDIQNDYYWSIDPEQRYNVYAQPTDLSVGQITDDWAEVRAIANGEKEAIGYGLTWLASVLRAAGEQTVG